MNTDKKDRRVQKTKLALHRALIDLMQERKYEAILVQDILDRADIGRSTFYMHYRDKDELLLSGMTHLEDFLAQAQDDARPRARNDYEKVIGFSRAMFEHAYEHRQVYQSLLGGGGWVIIRRTLEEIVANLIKKEIKRIAFPAIDKGMPLDLFVYTLGSTFWTLTTWWMNHFSPLEPQKIDDYFRELALPILAAKLGRAGG